MNRSRWWLIERNKKEADNGKEEKEVKDDILSVPLLVFLFVLPGQG